MQKTQKKVNRWRKQKIIRCGQPKFCLAWGNQKERVESIATESVGNGRHYSKKEFIYVVKDVNAVLGTAKAPLTKEIIMMAQKLKATQEYGAGTEATDLGAVTAKGSA